MKKMIKDQTKITFDCPKIFKAFLLEKAHGKGRHMNKEVLFALFEYYKWNVK